MTHDAGCVYYHARITCRAFHHLLMSHLVDMSAIVACSENGAYPVRMANYPLHSLNTTVKTDTGYINAKCWFTDNNLTVKLTAQKTVRIIETSEVSKSSSYDSIIQVVMRIISESDLS